MIHIEEKHKAIIREILSRYPYKFYAFGSRVHGTHQLFSDFDICCMSDLSESEKANLSAAFEESDLPFKIDIIEWNKISPDFQNIIKDDLTLFLPT